jgi:signal transduction histidine kinase
MAGDSGRWKELQSDPAAHGASISVCAGDIQILIQDILEPGHRLDVRVPGDMPMANCDPLALRAAVLNLVLNARDAMPAGGAISFVATNAAPTASRAEIELRISDEGIGMTPDTLTLAREPFFTTKSTGLGGLGLPLVERFIQDSGGSLTIASSSGDGTMVTLRLPALTPRG